MARRKNHLRQAIGLMVRTRPFLRARLAVYGVFFFATIGYFATFILLLRAYHTSAIAQAVIIAVAVGLYLLGRRYLGRYLSYVGHAPHIMAMVTTMKGEQLPRGHPQIELSCRFVDERFPETTRLVQLEGLIGRVLQDSRQLVLQPGQVRPLPGFARLGKLSGLILYFALRRFRDAVFGYTFHVGRKNVWQSARKGLTLFAEHAEKLAKTAVRVYLFGILVGLIFVGVMVIVGRPILSWAQAEGIVMLLVVLAGLARAAWVLKSALFDPVALAWNLSVFLRQADETPTVDERWAERLQEASKRFREIGERAKAFQQPPPERPEPTEDRVPTQRPAAGKAVGPDTAAPSPPPDLARHGDTDVTGGAADDAWNLDDLDDGSETPTP